MSVELLTVDSAEYTLSGGGWGGLASLNIDVASATEPLFRLEPGILSLRIQGQGSYMSTAIVEGLSAFYVNCDSVFLQLRDGGKVHNSARFRHCRIDTGGKALRLGACFFEGSTSITGHVEAEWGELTDGIVIELDDRLLRPSSRASIQFDKVRVVDEGPNPVVHIKGGDGAVGTIDGITLNLYGGATLEITDTASDVSISSDGNGQDSQLVVNGELADSWIDGVHMTVGGVVNACAGNVLSLNCQPGSNVIGSTMDSRQRGPLVVKKVKAVAQADISGVDVFSCDTADLAELEHVARLDVWLPQRTREAVDRAAAMAALTPQQRAFFWTRLSILAREKSSTGSKQSQLRYVAAEMRRQSTFGRERALLETYRLVGYGERIGRPLLWFALIVASMATALTIIGNSPPSLQLGAWWANAWRLMVSPLAFFRLDAVDHASASETWRRLVFLVVQAAGIGLLLFSLLATRRIARAE